MGLGRLVLLWRLAAVVVAPVRTGRRWWQRVLADICRLDRPIFDRRFRPPPGEVPLHRRGRIFCPHPDRSPLRFRRLTLSRPGEVEPLFLILYYCEIEGLYWTRVVGGMERYNLLTGPYRLGVRGGVGERVGGTSSRPATQPSSRPVGGSLRLRLERRGRPGAVPLGASPGLILTFINTGCGPLRLNTDLASARLELKVWGPEVVMEIQPSAPPTQLGRRGKFVLLPVGGRWRMSLRSLSTGGRRYRLARPGLYLIRAVYINRFDDGRGSVWTGRLGSNLLMVQVAGAR